MSTNVWIGVFAVVLLGGGMVAFTQFRAEAAREAEVAGVLAEVADQVGLVLSPSESFDPEQGRVVLRSLRRVRDVQDDRRLGLAEAQLLLALGQVRDAWDLVRPLATEPGADVESQAVGASVAARLGAETGDVGLLGQAAAMARRYAEGMGDGNARILTWQLAFRVGDAEAMVAAGDALLEAGGSGAALVTGLSSGLAEVLAQRLGLDPAAADSGPVQVALGRLGAQGKGRPSVRELDELAARFPAAPPELELVAARRALEEFGELAPADRRGGEAENLLRDAVRRIEQALLAVPSSADARAVAVLALLFTRESFGLDPTDAARFQGHLEWLLANGPKTHVQRAVWEQLARDVGR
ncbi:MAG: hypothetical protein RL562_2526 [Planctomycetota bacterium]|jgi:hypothetical protein